MFQQQVFIINIILMAVDAVCIISAGYIAHTIRSYQTYWLWSMEEYSFALSILFVMFLNNLALGKVGLYTDRRITSTWSLALAVLKAICIDFSMLAAVVFLLDTKEYSRAFVFYFAVATFILLFLTRLTANVYINHIAQNGFNTRRLLLIGDGARGSIVAKALDRQLSLGHRIVHHIELTCTDNVKLLHHLSQTLKEKEVDEVIFAVDRNKVIDFQAHIDICSRMGIPVRVLPALWQPDKPSVRVEQCQGVPFLTMHVNNLNPTGLLYKRLIDIIGSLVGTVLLMMMYPFIAIAIKLDSPGPVLFKQDRVGQNGRIFKAYKFRSMYIDAERRKHELMHNNEMSGKMFKMKNDPRITRIGKFLRSSSLDEFPQFLNVLKGEMSLVGTRPPTPDEVKKYDLCEYKRISAKPGITGMWQVSGRNKITEFSEVVQLDCHYLENWHFSYDIKILLKTFWVVIARRGAC